MKKVALLVTLLPFYALADFITAIDDYQDKKYESAYTQFLEMAKMGETRSQFNLGVMYYNGEFVENDINKAYAWLKLATYNETATEHEKQVFQQISSQVSQKDLAQSTFLKIENYSNKNLLVNLYPEFLNTDRTNPDNAIPLEFIQPRYPRKAALKGTQGWVKFRFDLDKLGHPRNIMLLEAVPKNMFEKSSLNAINKWRFKPSVDSFGKMIETKDIIYTMEYRLGTKKTSYPIQIKKSALEKAKKELQNNSAHAQYQLAIWSKYGLIKEENTFDSNKLFLSSAIQGHPISQFEIGRSLVLGKGCKQDKEKGLSWLNRAASNGQPNAKEFLANVLMSKKDLASQRQAVNFYQTISKKSSRTSINLARLLTESKYHEILNPKKAIDIVNDISSRIFSDDITIYEIKAKAYFKMGEVKKAISYQEDALEEAEDRGVDVTKIKSALEEYIQHKDII